MLSSDETVGAAHAWAWHHAGLVVEDVDVAIDRYHRWLGFEVEFDVRAMGEQFARTVGVPGVSCDLVQLRSPLSETLLEVIAVHDVPPGLDPRLPVHVGIGHTAFVVDDLERAVAELERSGGALIGEVVEFAEGPAAYCRTPIGTVVELEARP